MKQTPNPKASPTRVLTFAFIGHFLELYDYTAYVVMLPIISPLFFPSDSHTTSVSIGMIIFAISLCIGPVGAWFWGKYGDKVGRLPMLRQSIMLMAMPSLTIAILPTYNIIGIYAPILLMICRFVQTFSASGEINGAKIFAMEHLGEENQGKVSGLISFAGGAGVLLAMGIGLLLAKYDYTWRLPFFVGSSLVIVGILIRRKVAESPEFAAIIKTTKPMADSTTSILSNNLPQSIIVVTLAAVLGILSYTMHAFLNLYIKNLGFLPEVAYQTGIVGLISCGIFSLLTGYIIDRKKNVTWLMQANIVASAILAPICFAIILSATEQMIWPLFVAVIIFGGLLGMNATCCAIIMYRLFLPQNRCRGVMFSYSIGMAMFGGLTPITLTISTKFSNFTPGIIIAVACTIAYLVYLKNSHIVRKLSLGRIKANK